ncbi:DinB/UmuC family translesion DNA polymerase [Streptomyces hydrogenans]|uniref:DinB/UmuC family translesion DNA polymerase n=1 Tax=Streptomyces hydrogenans TaxID=1873719 RepID=UPI0035D9EACF
MFSEAPRRLAQRFQLQAIATYGVRVHIGVADTWPTAATASAPTGPSGILHLPDHRTVETFPHPLPVDTVHGIGPTQTDTLRRFGLHTTGALAVIPEDIVCPLLGGKKGRLLRDRARGIDPARSPHTGSESTSAHTGFPRDECDAASMRAAVLDLVTTVGERIRRRDQGARKATLTMGFAGGASITRTRALPAASGHTEDLHSAGVPAPRRHGAPARPGPADRPDRRGP